MRNLSDMHKFYKYKNNFKLITIAQLACSVCWQIGFLVGQVVAIHNDCAAGDFFQAVQAAQKSRLAAAGGAEDDNDLALIDIRRYIAQDLEVAEVFFQMLNVNFDILLIDAHG